MYAVKSYISMTYVRQPVQTICFSFDVQNKCPEMLLRQQKV